MTEDDKRSGTSDLGLAPSMSTVAVLAEMGVALAGLMGGAEIADLEHIDPALEWSAVLARRLAWLEGFMASSPELARELLWPLPVRLP